LTLNPTDASISSETRDGAEPGRQEVCLPLAARPRTKCDANIAISLSCDGTKFGRLFAHAYSNSRPSVFFSLSLFHSCSGEPFKKSQDELEAKDQRERGFPLLSSVIETGGIGSVESDETTRGGSSSCIRVKPVSRDWGRVSGGIGFGPKGSGNGKWGTPGFVFALERVLRISNSEANEVRHDHALDDGLKVPQSSQRRKAQGKCPALKCRGGRRSHSMQGQKIELNNAAECRSSFSSGCQGSLLAPRSLQAGAIVEAKKKNDTVYARIA